MSVNTASGPVQSHEGIVNSWLIFGAVDDFLVLMGGGGGLPSKVWALKHKKILQNQKLTPGIPSSSFLAQTLYSIDFELREADTSACGSPWILRILDPRQSNFIPYLLSHQICLKELHFIQQIPRCKALVLSKPNLTSPFTSAQALPHESWPFSSFLPSALASDLRCPLAAFLHWKAGFCCCWGPRESSYGAVPCRAPSDHLSASYLLGVGDLGPAHPHSPMYTIAWTAA